MLAQGTTTFECKSGLRAHRRATRPAALALAAEAHRRGHLPRRARGARPSSPATPPATSTWCAARCSTPARRTARWVDVFCERGAFGGDEARAVLTAGHGARPAPADPRQPARPGPGRPAGGRAGRGVGRPLHVPDRRRRGRPRPSTGSTVATLLPGAEFGTRQPYPDARRLLDAGATVALATDCNPGSSYTSSHAVLHRPRGPRHAHDHRTEAVWSATAGGARALRRGDVGYLAPGARADLVMLDAPSHAHLAYRPGVPLVHTVYRYGRWQPLVSDITGGAVSDPSRRA